MSPAARVRLLVGAAAVAAAGGVTGVVLATRQDPPQPRSNCKQQAQPLIVPGVATRNAAGVKAAFALRGKQVVYALERVEQRAPKDAVVQFNYGIALYCAGYLAEAGQAFRAAKTTG